jgi:molecular chaperone DnaJ
MNKKDYYQTLSVGKGAT